MSQQTQGASSHRGYRFWSTLDEVTAKQLLDDIIENSCTVKKVFQDSHSTHAAHLQVGDQNLVDKIPRTRLKRTWEKMITLIRHRESIRIFDNLRFRHQLAFKTPIPLLAGDKRQKGLVTGSFCYYRFAEGNEAGPDDAQAAFTELPMLHKKAI